MSALKARVENGRLELDAPTDLLEGTVAPLEIADDWDDPERAGLHDAIREGFDDAKAGRTIDAGSTAKLGRPGIPAISTAARSLAVGGERARRV